MGYALVATERDTFQSVHGVISEALRDNAFPGAVCIVARGRDVLLQEAYGNHSFIPLKEESEIQPVTLDSVYDLDSLTSSLITTSIAMKAVEQDRINLQGRISRYVHGFGVFGKSPLKIIDLLHHESGLPESESFYHQVNSLRKDLPFGTPIGRGVAQHVLMLLNRLEPKMAAGQASQYSEVGMLLLGFLLEELWAKRLDELAQQFLFTPLDIQGSGFIDHGLVRQGKFRIDTTCVVPSEECTWRRRVLQGEARDENTWAMGGISGEAGFFANAADVTILVQSLLSSHRGIGAPLISRSVVQSFFDVRGENRSWALGWAKARTVFGVEVPELYQESLGAVSPTGCAVWLDPNTGLSVVFLSNRTMPSRANKKIGQFWPKFLKAVWSELG